MTRTLGLVFETIVQDREQIDIVCQLGFTCLLIRRDYHILTLLYTWNLTAETRKGKGNAIHTTLLHILTSSLEILYDFISRRQVRDTRTRLFNVLIVNIGTVYTGDHCFSVSCLTAHSAPAMNALATSSSS